ncbi:MAG TPA: N-methyl-L-tryptophan oxidase [Pseudomonadales bacterium]|nr:N-methyl-L-tryptophan oxidase [Pseudomonadales bacterium]
MPANHYDCIVIGAGGIGSAAIYHLALRGARVLGIDQYEIAHDKGSSHGETRAIRLVYFEHPDYVPLLRRAYELWEDLDETSDVPLFIKTGILQAGPENGEVLSGLLTAAAAHDLPMERLTAADVPHRFPGFSIDESDAAFFDPHGGILRVESCIRTHIGLAKSLGASIVSSEMVRHWYPTRDKITVETSRSTYTADKLVIAPGAWAQRLLPRFSPHLHIRQKSLFWFDNEDDCYFIENNCPVFLFERGEHTFYGFPAIDESGIKVADHAGGITIASPEDLDRHVRTDELEAVSLMLRHNLPQASHQLNRHTTCMYTMSEDGHFLVGHYPEMPRVSVVAGLSGHGFKFASVLGEIMADLTLDGRTVHPIEFLSPERFENSTEP